MRFVSAAQKGRARVTTPSSGPWVFVKRTSSEPASTVTSRASECPFLLGLCQWQEVQGMVFRLRGGPSLRAVLSELRQVRIAFSSISYSRNDQVFMYKWYVLRIQVFSVYWAFYLLQFDHPVINQNWVSFSWIFESPSKISFPKSHRVYTKDYSNSWENEYLTFPTRAQSHPRTHPVPSVCSGAHQKSRKMLAVLLLSANPPPPSPSPDQPVFHRLELRWDLSRCSWRHTCSHNSVTSPQAHRRHTESKISCFQAFMLMESCV